MRAAVARELPGWRVVRHRATVSDTAIAVVRAPTGRDVVVKVATSAAGRRSLARERAVLATLQQRLAADDQLRPRLPRVESAHSTGPDLLVLTRLPGRPARRRLPLARVSEVLQPLHELDARTVSVGPEELGRWVTAPVAAVLPVLPTAADQSALAALAASLRADLLGRPARLGWVHGDAHPGNLLASGDVVTAVLDWEQARPDDLPSTDLAFWSLTTTGAHAFESLGHRVARRLLDPRAAAGILPGELPASALFLLAWLRHVNGNLAKSTSYGTSHHWLRHAVLPVLEVFRDGAPPAPPMVPVGSAPRVGRSP